MAFSTTNAFGIKRNYQTVMMPATKEKSSKKRGGRK